MEPMSYATSPAPNTIIDRDREFDQTAKTVPADVCSGCGWPAIHGHKFGCANAAPALIGANAHRSVSPAILEFRNEELDAENRDLKDRLAVANRRIAGYEQMAAAFAAKIDEITETFKGLTGTPPTEFVAADCGKATATPNEYEIGRCVFPAGHSGPCSIGV